MNSQYNIRLLVIAMLLAGCGGGGGGGGTGAAPASRSPAEGVYSGSTSTGYAVQAIVLENGTWWALYGNTSGTSLLVQGISTGTSSASNGTFTASLRDFLAPGNNAVNATMSGTYASGNSINGTLTENGTPISLTLGPPGSGTTYSYAASAVISDVAGTWSGGLLDGETATVTVNVNGTLSGTSNQGCSFSGTFMPRATGKNVFDVSLTFATTGCALNGQTVTGNAIDYPLTGGLHQLIVGLVNSSASTATAFFAQR